MKKILAQLILNYFRFFARLMLKKNRNATIIGITGSAGKTSTRLALVQILKSHGIVKHSSHANSQSGISLNILGISPRNYSLLDWLRLIILAPVRWLFVRDFYNYYVVEMGIDSPKSPGNMGYLLSIIRPHVGVILGASLVHSDNFDHLVKDVSPLRRVAKLILAIAKEKMQLAIGLPKSGVAIINLDQKEFNRPRQDVSSRVITFGKSEFADFAILGSTISSRGSIFRFNYLNQTYKLVLPDIYSPDYGYTFAAALASAAAVGIPPTIAIQELSHFRSPAGRLRLFEGKKGTTIIDSSYNASPSTVLESLKLLKILGGRHKKIAILGDMRELGFSEKIAHKDLADWLPKYCDEAILFGKLTKTYTVPVLVAQKFPVHHFSSMSHLNKYLLGRLTPKACILVKGSQNTIFLERAVEVILAHGKDVADLCRRGVYWDKLRSRTP